MVSEESQNQTPLTDAQRRRLLQQIYQVILADAGVAAAPTPTDAVPQDLEEEAVPSPFATADDDATTELPIARPRRRAA